MSWPWDAVAYTSGPAMLESALSFFSQQGGQCQWCATQPLSDRNKGFVVIYIGGLHE